MHPSRTDPDTNIRSLRDGTIVIKDSTTVGDNVATQVIREKYSDPSNQTVVYICESVPQQQKAKSRDNSKMEPASALNQSQKDDSRNCEVSLDNSRGHNSRNIVGGDSRDIQYDYPRDGLDEDVSRDSGGSMRRNYLVYPSIHETCIRYSKDILEMLNNHSIEEKKGLDMFLASYNDVEEIPTCFNISNEAINEKKEVEDEDFKEVKLIKDDGQSEGFTSNTLSRCEKYFLEMYRNKCRAKGGNDQYLKKFREYYDTDCRRCISKHDSLGCGESPISQFRSNSAQTIDYCRLNKNTQTSQTNLLSPDGNFNQSILSEDVIPRNIGPKENHVSHDNSDEVDVINDPGIVNRNRNTEIWNNSNVKSGEITFEETEFSAYSTPFYEELPGYYPPEMVIARDINDCPIKYEAFEAEDDFNQAKFYRSPETRRLCGVPHKVLPIRRYVIPPAQIRQTKMLSPRTLRKIPAPKIRQADVPLSVRSRSLPTCAEFYGSRQEPVRLHKIKRSPQNGGEEFVDVAFVVEDRNFRKKLATKELRGFVELSGRDKAGYSGKRLMHDDRFARWSKMNNSY